MLLDHVHSQCIPRLQYLWTLGALMDNAGYVGFDVLLHCVLDFAGVFALGTRPCGFALHWVIIGNEQHLAIEMMVMVMVMVMLMVMVTMRADMIFVKPFTQARFQQI